MTARIAPLAVEGQHIVLHKAFACSIFTTQKPTKKDQSVSCLVVLSSPYISRKLLRSQTSDKPVSRCQSIKRYCSSNLNESSGKQNIEGSEQGSILPDDEGNHQDYGIINKSSVASQAKHLSSRCRMISHSKNTPLPSELDFLEPMMLGIRPEPPDWPERKAVLWSTIEHKAKSFDLPLSLRMIKKKQQLDDGLMDLGYSGCCSVKKAFSSMVSILVELQSHALQMREAVCDEDLKMIIKKVQRDMHSSFLWLFQQVFSRTPELMIHVMILLADFSAYSTLTSHNIAIAENVKLGSNFESAAGVTSNANDEQQQNSTYGSLLTSPILFTGSSPDPLEVCSKFGDRKLRDIAEMSLWNSILDDAAKMQSTIRDVDLDRNTDQFFVAPLSVEVEPDDYTEYNRTDLLYQLGLSQDPDNQLLLCNYAQFLHFVARDYGRAEVCYKRAVQVSENDAECLSQYANFLWTIKKDFWGAEERYLQALAAEPNNPYYASKYANFLWSTGGEETCYPLNSSSNENKSLNL